MKYLIKTTDNSIYVYTDQLAKRSDMRLATDEELKKYLVIPEPEEAFNASNWLTSTYPDLANKEDVAIFIESNFDTNADRRKSFETLVKELKQLSEQ